MLLTAGLVALLGSEVTFGNSDPNINDASFGFPGVDLNSLGGAKSGVGLDGKIRILWDVYAGLPASTVGFPDIGTPALNQSQLWILNADGTIGGQFILPQGSGPNQSFNPIDSTSKSNILFQGQADGNTTILFLFSSGFSVPVNELTAFPVTSTTGNPVNGFSVITVNASGQAVSAATYGPFAGTVLVNIHFVGPDIVALWASRTNDTSSTYTGWGLNEFGSVIGANGPFAFENTFAKVDVLTSTNQQVWYWDSQIGNTVLTGGDFPFNVPAAGQNVLGLWIINNDGSFAVAQSYGPY